MDSKVMSILSLLLSHELSLSIGIVHYEKGRLSPNEKCQNGRSWQRECAESADHFGIWVRRREDRFVFHCSLCSFIGAIPIFPGQENSKAVNVTGSFKKFRDKACLDTCREPGRVERLASRTRNLDGR